ncbi:uncharacterized protein LOC126909378 [Daktulosphaira vitifoliae]|uniref:uncharacterized protein LOC126909378 n=2 Tax=Daktulosphaira vitifoliae TaxID=58002 RepID=UPI0021AAA4DA|nr:uncharacterized protein LOC126909378 [Daktulosphaira vitifoliae]
MHSKNVFFRKVIFVLLGIYCFLICKSTSFLISHELVDTSIESYDITLVRKLKAKCSYFDSYNNITSIIDEGNYICFNNAEIHSRTNAIGLPVYFNGRILKSRKKSLEFIVDSFYPNSIYTKNNVEYESMFFDISSSIIYNRRNYGYTDKLAVGNSLNFMNSNNEISFKIDWIQDETVTGCISMTYFKDVDQYNSPMATSFIKIYQDDTSLGEFMLKNTDDEFKTLIMKFNRPFEKNKKYYLTITNDKYDSYSALGIKRIAQCTDSGKVEDVYEIHDTEIIRSTSIVNIYPSITREMAASTYSPKECGKNKYGADCTAWCSQKKTFCQNMLFCTNNHRCSCAAGYTGPLCNQECPEGTYGHGCQKICSNNCKTQCDNILGTCKGGCKNNFIMPYCIEKYPVLIEPPKLDFSDFHSINLVLNLLNENIFGSKSKIPSFYQIVYKPISSELDFQYSPIKPINTFLLKDKISNLEAATMYTVGVILITEDGNSNKDDINTANYFTKCFNPKKINYEMKLAAGADNITVTWEKLRKSDANECNITSYILKLMSNLTRNENSVFQEEVLIKDNEYVFNNLIPSHTYAVQLIGQTILGTINVPDVKYATTETFGFIDIEHISVLLGQNSDNLLLKWKLSELINSEISYIIKYKVNRHFSCSNNIINNDWKEIIVHNVTECYLFDLIPNSQYIIKVEPITNGYNYSDNENIIYAMTAPSTPRTSPVLDNNGTFYVSNQTASIKWLVDKNQCVKVNGFQTGFYYKLKNLAQDTIIENDTDDTSIEFNNLMPNTSYVLEVYINTNKGYNENFVLKVPFQTKSKFLPAIENLSVYKKNSKTKTIGLRWSYDNESDINGFIIHLIASNYKVNSKQMTIEVPSRCTAWPDMYCETIDNLTPSTQYTIKIKAKSLDYPNGGLVASEDFNTVDGIPDEPGNLTITYVGTNNISLEWNIPWMFNGALNSFIINAEEVSAIDIDSCCSSYPPIELLVTEEKPTYTYTLDNLKPGSTYAIGVLSKTSWYSQVKRIHVTTLID